MVLLHSAVIISEEILIKNSSSCRAWRRGSQVSETACFLRAGMIRQLG